MPSTQRACQHGYLPRNGQNIAKGDLKAVIMEVFNIANDTATVQVNPVPEVFSLDYLGRHVLPEHDASLVRTDVYFGHDPMEIKPHSLKIFWRINTTAVAHTRRDRVTMCEAINPECTFGANEKQTAFLQAALLLTVLGQGDFISVDHARSFLVEEQIPSDFVKAAEAVS
ncbi:Chloroperoxidase [Phytophthora cactorum]|nr:Chloroperoxidase [Phytophthora cactorum]